jgi:hypothetical protein
LVFMSNPGAHAPAAFAFACRRRGYRRRHAGGVPNSFAQV